MRALALGLILGISVVAAAPALAQQGTTDIGCMVVDQQKSVLPGVAIVITNEDSGVFREVVTGANGSYFVSQIVPGRYRIRAKLEGFRSLDRRNILLEVGKTTTLRERYVETPARSPGTTPIACNPNFISSAPATSARCGEESRWRRTTSG
jgi:hypothetical protein